MLDWTISYGPITIGDAETLPAVNFTNFDPVSMPDIRSNDLTLIQRDGLWAGDDYLGGKSIALSLEVQAVDPDEFSAAVNLIMRAFSPGVSGETPLRFRIPGLCNGREAYVNVRTRRRSAPLDANFARLRCAFEVELFATDPVIYATEETAVTLRKGVPARVPVDGSRSVTPVVTFSGATGPKLLDAVTGEEWTGEFPPGENFLEFTDSGTNANATALLKFRDTWV